jgi:hypothetical protein
MNLAIPEQRFLATTAVLPAQARILWRSGLGRITHPRLRGCRFTALYFIPPAKLEANFSILLMNLAIPEQRFLAAAAVIPAQAGIHWNVARVHHSPTPARLSLNWLLFHTSCEAGGKFFDFAHEFGLSDTNRSSGTETHERFARTRASGGQRIPLMPNRPCVA